MTAMPNDVAEYFAKLNNAQREKLGMIRELVLSEVPSATELISYQMPAFKYEDKVLLYYGAFEQHVSIFPVPLSIEEEVEDYIRGKGTLRVLLADPLPIPMLHRIVRAHKDRVERGRGERR